jgi:hypothetical protein
MTRVRRGDTVTTYGPWSNGHMEQVAIVTHVYGYGDEDSVLVNLHVFVDLGQPLITHEVPFHRSRMHALAAMAAHEAIANAGAVTCWPRESEP